GDVTAPVADVPHGRVRRGRQSRLTGRLTYAVRHHLRHAERHHGERDADRDLPGREDRVLVRLNDQPTGAAAREEGGCEEHQGGGLPHGRSWAWSPSGSSDVASPAAGAKTA